MRRVTRSQTIVALAAFFAGALVVWMIVLAARSRSPDVGPVRPKQEQSDLSLEPQAAVENANVATQQRDAADPSVGVVPIPVRKAAERRTTSLLGGFVRTASEAR